MRNPEKTKEKILLAAETLVAEGGLASLRVNLLADRAGVGKPLIYRYFHDMRGVRDALLSRSINQKLSTQNDDVDPVRQVLMAARALAGDQTCQGLMAASLGEGQPDMQQVLARLGFQGKNEECNPREAVMMAAAFFLVMASRHHENWMGVPISKLQDLARLEFVFAEILGD